MGFWPIRECAGSYLCFKYMYIYIMYIYIYIYFFFFFFQFSAQIKLTVQGLFDLNQNIPAFKEHLRDFMVQIKVGDWNVQH